MQIARSQRGVAGMLQLLARVVDNLIETINNATGQVMLDTNLNKTLSGSVNESLQLSPAVSHFVDSVYEHLSKLDQPEYAQHGAYYFFASLAGVDEPFVTLDEGKNGFIDRVRIAHS